MEAVKTESPLAAELSGVTVLFRDVPVLDDVTLGIERGEFLAILGPNGSGKTTLLKVITGLIRPERGSVRVFGRSPEALGRDRWRIGYLPQTGALNPQFPVTAREVVMMARYAAIGPGRFPGRADRDAVSEALARVEALDFALQPIGKLSGGQRQRVFLARSLVNRPELLILDEPTTAMDVESEEKFYDTLQQLHREGTTILIVSHDIGVVSTYVDRVACLNHRLVAHGRPEAVMSEEVLQEMYGCHSVFLSHGGSPHMVVKRHP
jgi:zinc transport system ATP-binding protein